jgi:hypothetical protein
MSEDSFKAGPHVVSYGLHIQSVGEYLLSRVLGVTTEMLSSPREELQDAFRQAGVEGRFMGGDMTGVVNCDLASEDQFKKLQAAGYRPEPGHCGAFSIL